MAGRTTALMILGDYSVGPFQERQWKARHVLALIEKHRFAWTVAAIAHGSGEPVPPGAIYLPRGWSVAQEAVFVAAACAVREKEFMGALDTFDLLERVEGRTEQERWLNIREERLLEEETLPSSLIQLAIDSIRNIARIGVVRLEADSSFDDQAIAWLRTQGFDVDDFEKRSVGGIHEN